MNNLNLSPEMIQKMLGLASKQLGVTPEQLKSSLEQGSLDGILPKDNPNAQGIREMMQHPDKARDMLKSQQFQDVLKKLSK